LQNMLLGSTMMQPVSVSAEIIANWWWVVVSPLDIILLTIYLTQSKTHRFMNGLEIMDSFIIKKCESFLPSPQIYCTLAALHLHKMLTPTTGASCHPLLSFHHTNNHHMSFFATTHVFAIEIKVFSAF
jgi:hypothetical protein